MPDPPQPRRLSILRPENGGPPLVAEGELHHARNVLRLQKGDEVLGLDGVGGLWPLRIAIIGRKELVLEVAGEPHMTPSPGEPGGGPHVEVALSLPRAGRAEDTVDRLTQLGMDRLALTIFERTPPSSRELPPGRSRRLERAAREACKQAIRAWVPEIRGPVPLEESLSSPPVSTAVLDPRSDLRLADWLDTLSSPSHLSLVVGPEGGLTEEELEAASGAGAVRCWLGPHVLRIETAAELATGLVRHHLASPGR